MSPIPPYLSHLIIRAQEVEPRREGESDLQYVRRLESLGHSVAGVRDGEVVLVRRPHHPPPQESSQPSERPQEPQKAQDHPVEEANIDLLPEHLSHLIRAEDVEPRREGELDHAYFRRLETQGYRMYGYRHGELLLVNRDGKLKPRVKAS
jgi:hypothetical protein